MSTPNKQDKGRDRSQTTGSINLTNRLSFGGPIRLNDLLNDDDEYGFAEEATENSLLEYESHTMPISVMPLEMLIEDPPSSLVMASTSACSSSSLPSSLHGSHRSMVEDFDGGLLYSSRDRLDEGMTLNGGEASAAAEKSERVSLGGISAASHDSTGDKSSDGSSTTTTHKEHKSRGIGALIDKAKHRLGASRERDKKTSNAQDLAQSIDAPDGPTTKATVCPLREDEKSNGHREESSSTARPSSLPLPSADVTDDHLHHSPLRASSPVDSLTPLIHLVTHHITTLPFAQARAYGLAVLIAMTAVWPGFLVGVAWGVYLSVVSFLFFFVSEPRVADVVDDDEDTTTVDDGGVMRSAKDGDEIEQASEAIDASPAPQPLPLKRADVVFKGWMNELPYPSKYDPSAYHVNSCRCVLVRLEGATLRMSRPSRAVLKHAFHTDPTLTAPQPSMVAQSIYDLSNATVSLRPKKLARRRWWSRKYPIYIRLDGAENDGKKRRRRRRRVRSRSTSTHRKRSVPRIKRSISMHPGGALADMTSVTLEQLRREEERSEEEDGVVGGVKDDTVVGGVNQGGVGGVKDGDKKVEEDSGDSDWSDTTDDESDDEISGEFSHCATFITQGGRVSRARSSTEISTTLQSSRRKPKGIYLFARAAREKERWFHLLREACAKARVERCRVPSGSPHDLKHTVGRSRSTTTMMAGDGFDVSPPLTPSEKSKRKESSTFDDDDLNPATAAAREFMLYRANHAHFARSMSEAMGVTLASLARLSAGTPSGGGRPPVSRDQSMDDDTQSVNLGSIRWKPSSPMSEGNADLVASVNAIAGRIFFDFCRDEYWCKQVKDKIQTKLATIHLPYFIEKLELSSLDLGTTTPHIESVYAPTCDEWGLWVDFELKYTGGIRLALETRVNLLKLQEKAEPPSDLESSSTQSSIPRPSFTSIFHRTRTRYSDETQPESPEDSPDEDFGAKMTGEKKSGDSNGRESAGSKIVSVVESISRSSIFQKAARLPKVAKVITDISSTRLILNVEVESIEGTMAVNLPPPPSDRIWYAFRKRPKVSIRAVPQVGDRSVDLTTVSDWIESKLRLLLEKNLVCPNMDDVIIPVMSGNDLLKMRYNL